MSSCKWQRDTRWANHSLCSHIFYPAAELSNTFEVVFYLLSVNLKPPNLLILRLSNTCFSRVPIWRRRSPFSTTSPYRQKVSLTAPLIKRDIITLNWQSSTGFSIWVPNHFQLIYCSSFLPPPPCSGQWDHVGRAVRGERPASSSR